jgi:hypothetical protein
MARQPGGLEVAGGVPPTGRGRHWGLLALTFVWTILISRLGLELVGPVRTALFQSLLANLLVSALIAPKQSATSRFFCSRAMVFLGTYSYGLHASYLTTNRTKLELTRWLGSQGASGVPCHRRRVGFPGRGLSKLRALRNFKKRFLRLKRLFPADKMPAHHSLVAPISVRGALFKVPRL